MKKERREAIQQKLQRQRQRTYLIIGSMVVVIAAAAIVLFVLNQSVEIPEGATDQYAGLEQGVTPDGYPRLGEETAPITVVEFSSFGCPHCKTFHEEQLDGMMDYIRDGQ